MTAPSPVHPLKLAGAYGSPYSLKMRAVLRYRRIPFTWVLRDSKLDDLPPVPVRLIPVIGFPDAEGTTVESMIDSSPLIERLEGMYSGRSLVSTDPVVAFIDYVLEDYGDEWVTKQMFHYRWFYADAVEKAGSLLPLDHNLHQSPEQWAKAKEFITQRQIGRMALVGCTEANKPVIEASYVRLLDLLQEHLVDCDFLVGTRPGRGDFGIFGQLRQLIGWDPESARIAIRRAPRVANWVERTDDLSWWPVDGDTGWYPRDEIPSTTKALLHEVGRTYAPFMVANATALRSDAEEVVCMIDGLEYRQAPFPYQGKCLGWLRDQHRALSADDRAALDDLLAGTGCEQLFA
jgi:glutathione S-transferase